MKSEATTRNGSIYPLIANVLFSATLAFPSLAGVAVILGMILTAGFSPLRLGFQNYK